MFRKKMDEKKLNNITGGISGLDASMLVGASVATIAGSINFVRNWRKSDSKKFWDKYKDAVGPNTMIPGVISAALAGIVSYRLNNPYQ